MQEATTISLKNQPLFRCFLGVKDPRVQGRCFYPLYEILFITVCALSAGCDNWKSIELFGHERYRWLKQFLELANGIPSHLTIARVLSLLDPQQFEKCYREWMASTVNLIKEELINIDGKTVRGSSHQASGKKALHLVNAYMPRANVTLGSEKTPDKSNEIKAIPALLKTLNIDGCIITMDAMGTQKGIAKLINLKKGHYMLALKMNHKKFHHKVERLFTSAEELQFNAMVYRKENENDYGHNRIEKRRYTILPSMYLPRYQKEWKDCQAFIRVESKRYLLGQKKEETSCRYYITSLRLKQSLKMCEAIRGHWGVENGLHHKLDVGLHEDDSPIYRGHAAENLAIMRKIVLMLLQKDKSKRGGIDLRRKAAGFSTKYLRKVIGF